ncbi:SH3 domain-containing protein [Flavobacterium sp. KACC 22763]|uniref:SH3 domain-containing protein n=1 Tax=Flavobacterium sp. KACC 22763 TaxID=3025668 RepID=UPI00236523E0|nr:SH3 domain-containing protein [Flavobacterium sp. KACC 22763]WDF64937.1 SH3 domain-containing protein [Flavobacterium sp. KACC 22763]
MKNIISLLVLLLISCTGKTDSKKNNLGNSNGSKEAPYNLTDLGDGKKFNYDTLSIDYINKVKTSLIKSNFKFPDEQTFKKRTLEVFKINLYDYKNNIIVLRPAMFTEIAIKESRFILIEDQETDGSENAINENLEFYYNSYVFYEDKIAFNWLKSRYKQQLIDLVVQYGYNSDKELVKFVFKNYDFDDSVSFHDLIFTYDVKSKKYILRESILNDIESIVYKGTVEGYTEAKEGNGYNSFSDIIEKIRSNPNNYLDAEKYIAFLYEKDLRVCVVGHIESNLSENKKYKTFLKENNYFNLMRLKEYVEIVYGGDSDSDEVSKIFKISDPDGFTNLRKEKNSSSEILQKINNNTEVEVLDDSGNWWLIKTSSGNKGYVYKTKIKAE